MDSLRARRRGITLVELLVFSTASLMLIGVGWTLLRSGSIIGATTHEGLNLQQGVRNLLENLVRDTNAAIYILEPNGLTAAPANKVVLWLSNDELDGEGFPELGARLDINGGPNSAGLTGGRNPWPFFHVGEVSTWGIPVVQITYEWNEAEKTVTRIVEPGAGVMATGGPGGVFIDSFTFQPGGTGFTQPSTRLLAQNISQFDLYPFGYDETQIDPLTQLGQLEPTPDLPDVVVAAGNSSTPQVAGFTGLASAGGGAPAGTTERVARTSMLTVHITSDFAFANENARDQEIKMSTKIWSYPKLYEHVYFPYFSSIDDDLRF